MSVPPFFLLPSILRSDRLYSTRSVIRTGLPLTPGALTGALTLTGPLPGVYNLVSVGGALLARHSCTAQTARIEIAADWNRLPQDPVGIRSKQNASNTTAPRNDHPSRGRTLHGAQRRAS